MESQTELLLRDIADSPLIQRPVGTIALGILAGIVAAGIVAVCLGFAFGAITL
jgi:hypothetical protein